MNRKQVIVLGTWGAYLLAFLPLYRLAGIMAVACTIAPTLVTSWGLGTTGGALAGALALPVNLALLHLAGGLSAELLNPGGLLGWAVVVLIGVLSGRLHELSQQSTRRLAEREQIQETLEQQNVQLRTLLETAEILSTTLRFGVLLEQVLNQLQKLVSYDAAIISLIHGDQAQVVGCRGCDSDLCDDSMKAQQTFSLDEQPLIKQAVERKRPVLLADIGNDTPATGGESRRLRGQFHALSDSVSPSSWLATPLRARGRVIGALTIGSHTPQAYDEDTCQLVSAFTHQTALALENSRLYEQTRSQLREVTVLQGVTSAISSTLDIDQVLPYVARSLCEMLNATSVEIYSLEEESNRTAVTAGTSISASSVETTGQETSHSGGRHDFGKLSRAVTPTATLAASYATNGATQREHGMRPGRREAWQDAPDTADALRLGRPVEAQIEDVDLAPATQAKLAEREAKAMLLLPIMTRDRAFGFAYVWDSTVLRRFTEGEMATGQTLIHQTAIAMENARLFEQVQETLTETSVLYRTSRSLIAQEHLPDLLQTVVDGVIEALPADRATVITFDLKRQEVTNFFKGGPGAEHVVRTSFDELWNGLSGWVLREMQPALSPKGQNGPARDSRESPRAQERREATNCGSIIVVPLVYRDNPLGTMTAINRPEQRDFTEKDVDLMMAFANQAAAALENARLIEESHRRANQLAGAADIARHAAAVTDPASLLDLVVDLIQERFDFRLAAVFLVDPAEGNLYPAAATGDFWQIIPDGYRQPIGKGAIGTAAQTGETVRIADASRSAIPYRVGDWLSPSSLSVPIKVGSRVIGVLEAEGDVISAFSESDQMALEVIGDQIAIAYQNAELLTETRSRMKDLQLLHDVSLAAASSTHLQETLQAAAEALAREWRGTQIALQLIDRESGTLRMKAGVGYALDEAAELDLPLGEGITGWVAQHGQPVLASDVRDDPRYHAADVNTRSELCVPLGLGGRVLGTLNVESREIDAFTLDDQQLLTTLGSNLAMLIERARLFEEVEGARAELQQRAEALEQANARLKELDRLKSQFLANMSHELRTPLNSVIGFSEVLIDGLLGEMPPERKECVENIYASGEHLMALINDILDLSKIEAGRIELSPEPFDVTELIDNVQKTVTPMIEEKSQVLTIEIDQGMTTSPGAKVTASTDLPPLKADRIRVRQVLLNLLSNAHKFTPQGNEITLSCSLADPATMLFSVSDTGIGIKPEDQELIFEEFRQVDGTATREIEGTGLGLTISKRLVEMHGGTIWVESTYGEGAVFSFLLPLGGPPEPQETEGDYVEPHADQKVLIVEDDRQFSNLLSLYLRKEGYEPIKHYQGPGVLEQVRRLDPDLITLDIMLPGQDGWEILQSLKSDPQTRDIPVLVISALRNSELALSLGATDYLVKPVDRSALQTVLGRLPLPRATSEEPKILVIDDDTRLVPLLEAMLRHEPCTLVPAYDGEEGLAKAREEQPDGILLDLMMPGISGFEVLERLKGDERTADIPVIVLTVRNVTNKEREQLNEHIETLMHKSALTPQALTERIQRIGQASPEGPP
jgi:signal transduction histidine kinase/DNA-binding response OmpR family regulator